MNSVIGSRLKKARSNKDLTQIQVMEKTNINHKTLSGYENDVSEPDLVTLTVLAELYGVTTDYLLGRTDKNTHLNSLSPKEERDIAKDLEKILSNLESNEALAFDGEPLDDSTKELMRISLENSMRLAKQLAKKKFTPEKYK